MSEQLYTSKFTSVNTRQLPAIYKRINWDKIRQTFPQKNHFTVFDYGCGREWRHISRYMVAQHWAWIGWDPNWDGFASAEEFDCFLKETCRQPNFLGVILTSNVLNVIDDTKEIKRIKSYCAQSPNLLYFHKIYQGDKSGVPKITKNDCWQWNKPASWYIDSNFEVVKGGDIITHSLYTQFIKSK